MFSEYQDYDGLGLAELIRNGAVTVHEVLEAAIGRLETVNPAINAVVIRMFEEAGEAVPSLSGNEKFSGVPFLLKTSAALYKDTATTSGSRFFAGQVAGYDNDITTAYRRAGLLAIGKTNMPEMGINATTEPIAYGAARNPWDLELTAGGSSGGAGAAVASGITPIAHGTDGAGSIRIPASVNGVFGFKPTRARTPCGPDVGEGWAGLAINHVISRSVRDSAALLDSCSGLWPGDPYTAPAVEHPFAEAVFNEPESLRIAFTMDSPSGNAIHGSCRDAVQEAVHLCIELGHEVEEAPLPFDLEQAITSMRIIWSANLTSIVSGYNKKLGRDTSCTEGLETVTRLLIEESRAYSAVDYLQAVTHIHRTGREFAPFFENYDAYLSPVISRPPWYLGELNMMSDDVDDYLMRLFEICAFTPQFNLSGQPAMSVPLFWTDEQIPIGVQFAGRFGDDAGLFSLAGQLERARPWKDKRPPMK